MDLSRVSNTSLLGALLRLPLRLIPPQTVVPVMQGRLRGTRWIVGSSHHGCWLGSYEHAKRIAFEQCVAEGSVVFDVGAHVGYYTLLASLLVGPAGRVFAFEPLRDNVAYLKKHLRLNGVENVTVVEGAAADRSGPASFDEGANRSMGRLAPQGRSRVKTFAIDELVAAGEAPLPDYIKMDIEGAEALALAGARSTLERSRATIFLATHGCEIQGECRRFLASLGYRVQPLDGLSVEQSSELLATHG